MSKTAVYVMNELIIRIVAAKLSHNERGEVSSIMLVTEIGGTRVPEKRVSQETAETIKVGKRYSWIHVNVAALS